MITRASLRRFSDINLGPILITGLLLWLGGSALVQALGGSIPTFRGVDRVIVQSNEPAAFWVEVAFRLLIVFLAPIVGWVWAWLRASAYRSDPVQARRLRRAYELDKAVRRPLEP